METSPLNRLPEAHSLPDGFVESTAESPRSPNCTNSHPDGSIPEKENEEPKDYKEVEESSQPQDGVLIGHSPDESPGDCRSSQQGASCLGDRFYCRSFTQMGPDVWIQAFQIFMDLGCSTTADLDTLLSNPSDPRMNDLMSRVSSEFAVGLKNGDVLKTLNALQDLVESQALQHLGIPLPGNTRIDQGVQGTSVPRASLEGVQHLVNESEKDQVKVNTSNPALASVPLIPLDSGVQSTEVNRNSESNQDGASEDTEVQVISNAPRILLFKDAVKGKNVDPMPLKFTPLRVEGGNVIVKVEDDIKKKILRFQFDVIGRVTYRKGDKRHTTLDLKAKLAALWEIPDVDFSHLGKGYYHVFLGKMEHQCKVLSLGTMNLKPGFFIVSRWVSDFNPNNQKQTNAQCWIRLYDLPLEYRGPINLFNIARGVGVPLTLDTRTQRSGPYARVLVDVDCSEQLRDKILVRRRAVGVEFFVPVFYEYVPFFCHACFSLGHKPENCRSINSQSNYRQTGNDRSMVTSRQNNFNGGAGSSKDPSPSNMSNESIVIGLTNAALGVNVQTNKDQSTSMPEDAQNPTQNIIVGERVETVSISQCHEASNVQVADSVQGKTKGIPQDVHQISMGQYQDIQASKFQASGTRQEQNVFVSKCASDYWGVKVDCKSVDLSEESGNQEDLLIQDSQQVAANFLCLAKETEGCTELHTTDTKEKLITTDYIECPKNPKLENVEVKRKVGKRSAKTEKELLEFTLKYQKVIAERDAAISMRERLESLCRELQRQNKMLMDECQRVSTEGQNMRLDLSTKLNDAIKDVSIKLEEQKDECLAQLKENEMLRNKLKHLADQYALTEEQFSQKLKQKMLELQLADLKIQQHQERSAQEQTQMQLYAEQVTQLLATEKNLRVQLAADGEKFQQFQDALLKSNEVFETFKQEMEKMGKLIKELKKENEFLKGKCDKSDIALVKLVEERELMKKQLEKVKNQKERLESLCRSLQAERKQNSVGSTSMGSITLQARLGSSEEDS